MLGPAFGGRDISGGQWQRLGIARLLMRHSRVWILDEPTAAMDPESEEKIIASFRHLTKGRTAIIITHRFATARLADRIAVIDEGRVTEIGTHDELLAAKGQYARIFQMQAKAYCLPPSEQA
jgi:ATP-binding cassette, subfamily B, bacterial